MPLRNPPQVGLDRVTTAKKIYDALIEELVSGHLIRGEKLQEREIADYFQVSRTPLREAIRKLEHDGFLISEPYRGVFVRDYNKGEIEALFELRSELEAMSARLASKRASNEYIDKLKKMIARSEEIHSSKSKDETIRATAELHMLIAEASGNPWLYKIINQIQIHCSLLRHQAHHDPERSEEFFKEHQTLVEAIEARDAEKAEQVMRQHLDSARQFFIQIVLLDRASDGVSSSSDSDPVDINTD